MATTETIQMNDAQINHMVDRFLAWRLPADFAPDGGIAFDPTYQGPGGKMFPREPVGTNLLTAEQAKAMLLHMLEGLPQGAPLMADPHAPHFAELRRPTHNWPTWMQRLPELLAAYDTLKAELAAERAGRAAAEQRTEETWSKLTARVGELEAERDRLQALAIAYAQEKAPDALERIGKDRDKWFARAEAAEAQVAGLREALEPSADAAARYDPPEGDDASAAWAHDFTIGSLRRARAALQQATEAKEVG